MIYKYFSFHNLITNQIMDKILSIMKKMFHEIKSRKNQDFIKNKVFNLLEM